MIVADNIWFICPPIKRIEQVDYITNIEAFQLKSLPKSMIVIGGGALGVEFAQLFSFLLKITSNVQKNTGIKY